jgi:glycosyltransferase involved in cell wall biosynthesis
LERLVARAHEVTVLDYPILREHWPREPFWQPRQTFTGEHRVRPDGAVRVVRPGTLGLKPLARLSSVATFATELKHQARLHRPDLIVCYALSTGLPALMTARRHSIPLVFHVIDALHTIVPVATLQPIARIFERHIYRRANETLFITEHLRDYAISMGAHVSSSHVLRTGVDLTPPDESQRAPTRAALGVGDDELLLFFMGWLYDFAGADVVARLLSDLPANVRFLVVGDGDAFETLQRLRDERLGDRLILTGRVPFERIPAHLAAADVCLLPFARNPATEHIAPIKLYEYMAAARPVLASELPGVMRDVPPGNGVCYAPPSQWNPLILQMQDPDRRSEIGAKGRAFVEANCDWERLTDSFETLLKHIAESEA